jgi:hypothetical protein
VLYGTAQLGEQEMIRCIRNAGCVRRSIGTSVDLADAGVGADATCDHVALIVLSLSVNETVERVVRRDHPSGTLNVKRPADER